MGCDDGAPSRVVTAQLKMAKAAGISGSYIDKAEGNMCAGDEGVRWQESGIFKPGFPSGFNSDEGSGK